MSRVGARTSSRGRGSTARARHCEEVTAAPAAIETDVTPQVVNHCAPNCAEDAGALGKGKGGETVGYSTEAQIQNTQQGKINIGTRK